MDPIYLTDLVISSQDFLPQNLDGKRNTSFLCLPRVHRLRWTQGTPPPPQSLQPQNRQHQEFISFVFEQQISKTVYTCNWTRNGQTAIGSLGHAVVCEVSDIKGQHKGLTIRTPETISNQTCFSLDLLLHSPSAGDMKYTLASNQSIGVPEQFLGLSSSKPEITLTISHGQNPPTKWVPGHKSLELTGPFLGYFSNPEQENLVSLHISFQQKAQNN